MGKERDKEMETLYASSHKKQKHEWHEITIRVKTSPEKAHRLYEATASMLTWHGKFGKKLVLSAEITSEGECPECDGTGKEFSGWDRATGDPCYWEDSVCGGCSGTGWVTKP